MNAPANPWRTTSRLESHQEPFWRQAHRHEAVPEAADVSSEDSCQGEPCEGPVEGEASRQAGACMEDVVTSGKEKSQSERPPRWPTGAWGVVPGELPGGGGGT